MVLNSVLSWLKTYSIDHNFTYVVSSIVSWVPVERQTPQRVESLIMFGVETISSKKNVPETEEKNESERD